MEMQSCYVLACGLARNLEMGRNVYSLLTSNEVLPLTPSEYSGTLDSVLTYLDELNGAVRAFSVGGDILAAQSNIVRASAEIAGDGVMTLQHKVFQQQQLMDQYAGLIRTIQRAINVKIFALGDDND